MVEVPMLSESYPTESYRNVIYFTCNLLDFIFAQQPEFVQLDINTSYRQKPSPRDVL